MLPLHLFFWLRFLVFIQQPDQSCDKRCCQVQVVSGCHQMCRLEVSSSSSGTQAVLVLITPCFYSNDDINHTCPCLFCWFVPNGWSPALHHFQFLQKHPPACVSFPHFKSVTSPNAERPLERRGQMWTSTGGKPKVGLFWAVFSAGACECWVDGEWIMNELWLKLEMGHLRGQRRRVGADFSFLPAGCSLMFV